MKGEPFHILLVEDNPDHTELILRSFKDHRVINLIYHVSDGEAALDYLLRRGGYAEERASPRPHVILLDLRLPKVDGLAVLKTIKETEGLRRIPVVILTTSNAESDIARAYDYHANSYVVKPLDFTSFVELMDDLGFYWLGWNRNPWT